MQQRPTIPTDRESREFLWEHLGVDMDGIFVGDPKVVTHRASIRLVFSRCNNCGAYCPAHAYEEYLVRPPVCVSVHCLTCGRVRWLAPAAPFFRVYEAWETKALVPTARVRFEEEEWGFDSWLGGWLPQCDACEGGYARGSYPPFTHIRPRCGSRDTNRYEHDSVYMQARGLRIIQGDWERAARDLEEWDPPHIVYGSGRPTSPRRASAGDEQPYGRPKYEDQSEDAD